MLVIYPSSAHNQTPITPIGILTCLTVMAGNTLHAQIFNFVLKVNEIHSVGSDAIDITRHEPGFCFPWSISTRS